ncbi:MAG TPA: lipocalin-like domain-containing protein [Gammaproteobacteria bacterium]
MKGVLATLTAIVVVTAPHVSAAEDDAGSAGLVSSWTLLAMERLDASGEATRVRSPHGLLVFDAAGYVFEYFTAPGDASDARLADAQRAFAEHGGFWGRYEADAAAGRIDFEAASGVSPNVYGLTFSRRYELDGDRLVLTSADEPQAQRDTRWIWQRVPTVEHLTPAYREILGFWEHVEERRVDTATDEVLRTTRRAPSVIVYTPGGFVGVHFPRLDRASFAGDVPTAEEAQAALRGYIGYFGALTVYPGEVAHNVLGGLGVGTGAILRRAANVAGDELVVTLQNTAALIAGEPAREVLNVHLRRLSDADDMLAAPAGGGALSR